MKLMGYSGRSGRALSVVGALKQFDLLEGRDEAVRVTKRAVELLEPLSSVEYQLILRDTAFTPEVFKDLNAEFGGNEPSETVVRSIAIRKFGFTGTGADTLTKSYLETMRLVGSMEPVPADETDLGAVSENDDSSVPQEHKEEAKPARSEDRSTRSVDSANSLKFRLSKDTSVYVEFEGEMNRQNIERLIRHLELSAEIFDAEY
tara:strand:+ start:984 stop:1595 length:612 start_codon:yes stop_codon:yes gene_type:complete